VRDGAGRSAAAETPLSESTCRIREGSSEPVALLGLLIALRFTRYDRHHIALETANVPWVTMLSIVGDHTRAPCSCPAIFFSAEGNFLVLLLFYFARGRRLLIICATLTILTLVN